MTRPQRPEHETRENGIARDTTLESAANRIASARPEYQGYLLLITGTLLFLFSLGLLPILKWVIVAVAVGMIIWGAIRSNAVQRVTDYFERSRKRR